MGLIWPWSIMEPGNPFQALTYFSHFFEKPWKEMFDGAIVSVPDMPWSYLPTLFALQLPEVLLVLMTGAVDLVIEQGDDVAARNSVTTLDSRGNLLASYSKAHLVPGGEYLPLRGLLEPLGMRRLVSGSLDFWPGPGPRTLDLGPYGKAGVQICYEIVFSGEVVDPLVRPDFIFNPSNDGWFGEWGPPQHLAQARMRAIEEGLPVLRSTTNGISAVIDADGLVRASIPRHQAGRIDGRIPPAEEATPFARFGNLLPLGMALAMLVACAVALRRGRARDAVT